MVTGSVRKVQGGAAALVLAILLSGLCGVATAADAVQGEADPSVSQGERARFQLLMKNHPEADANNDGTLSAQEAHEYLQAYVRRQQEETFEKTLPDTLAFGKDISYGDGPNAKYQMLDILHFRDTSSRRPAIIMIHGGGWRAGDKSAFYPEMLRYANQGYVTMTVNYRFSQVAPFPAAVEDCNQAVRWLKAHAAQYGVDPERLGVTGGSAGAHLATMVALTDKEDGLEGSGPYQEQSSRVQACAALAGVYDFRAELVGRTPQGLNDPAFCPFLGGTPLEKPDVAANASPICHISKGDPPLLLFHGTVDRRVDILQAKVFAEALEKAKADFELVLIEGGGHEVAGPGRPEMKAKMDAFLSQHLRPAAAKTDAVASTK